MNRAQASAVAANLVVLPLLVDRMDAKPAK